jgi:hypothetical protein
VLGLPVWAGVVVLVIAILAVEVAVWRFLIVPRLRARMAGAVREAEIALGGEVVRSGTVSLAGAASSGRARGAGHLAIGRQEVVFVRLAPRSTLRIARARIDLVDTTRSHLGRRARHPFLRIAFRDEAGAADVVAFNVGRDTGPWEEALAAG